MTESETPLEQSVDIPQIQPEQDTCSIRQRWQSKIDTIVERGIRMLFFWECDDKKLGYLVRFLHHSMIYSTIIWYIVIHTFIPSYILFLCLYGFCFLIWMHHIVSWGCCFNRIEQKLTGDNITFVGSILEIFHIPVTNESTDGVVIMSATAVMFFLTFELASRTILNVRQWISF